jgi:CRP-like cAMP-binding protein
LDASRLRSIPLFKDVPDEELGQIATFAQEVTVDQGRELVREGDFSYEFMAIEEGEAEVVRDGERIGTLGPGDFFGEIGLFSRRWLRTATVVATSPMRLLVLGRHEFRELLAAFPAVAAPIREAASARA